MVEWNLPVCLNEEAFAQATIDSRMEVENFVRTKVGAALGHEVELVRASMMEFPIRLLTHKNSRLFGCSQDFDAYQRGNPCPAISAAMFENAERAIRFAGGHVHIGYENPNKVPDFVVVALCDATIGLRSISHGDVQGLRRKHYGSPGRYRPTRYGVEYRVLSNYWTFDNHYAYEIGMEAMSVGNMVEKYTVDSIKAIYGGLPWAEIRRAISTEDDLLASQLISYVAEVVDGAA